MTKISIVTSLYKSAPFVHEFYNRMLAALKQINVDYEFIFVNDGSPDDSRGKVIELTSLDKKVVLIDLSRNFGQYPAMFAGLSYSRGDYVFALDSDLEEEPENIIDFFNVIQVDSTIDIVCGVVEKRSGGIIRNYFGKLFYDFMDKFTDQNIPRDLAWMRLMRQNVVRELLRFEEAETWVNGLYNLVGFNLHLVPIKKIFKGHSSYTLKKRINIAFSAITSFTSRPLEIIGIVGGGISIIAFILLLVLVLNKIFGINYQVGWSSLIVSIWLVGGLILFSLGIIGIYLSRIFNQVKKRPLYIVKSKINYD